jgi:hypothetical protein
MISEMSTILVTAMDSANGLGYVNDSGNCNGLRQRIGVWQLLRKIVT